MAKIREKKFFNLCFALVLNLIFMVVCLALVEQKYDMHDTADYPVFISHGYYRFGFISYFFCLICGMLQSCIYPINAYVVLQVIFSLFALTAVSVIYLQKYSLTNAVFSIFLINSCYAIFQYTSISFSIFPALLGISGILCIVHYSKRKKWIFGTIVGIILMVLCSFYRIEIMLAVLFVGVMYVFGLTFAEFFSTTNNRRSIKAFFAMLFEKKRFFSFLTAVAFCFTFYFISCAVNNSTKDLEYYHKYTVARSDVWDYQIPEYSERSAEYSALGLDENDIELFKRGYMDDEGATSLKTLRGMKKIQSEYNKANKSLTTIISDMLKAVPKNIKGRMEPLMGYFSFGLTFLIMLVLMRKNRYFVPLFIFLGIFPLLFYLYYLGRTPYRTVHTFWISSLVYMLYSYSFDDMKPYFKQIYTKHRTRIIPFVLAITILMSPLVLYVANITRFTLDTYSNVDSTAELRKYIEKSDKKFVFSRAAGLSGTEDNVHYIVEPKYSTKTSSFNGTYYRYEAYEDSKKQFGYTNLYKSLFEDEVFFVDSNLGETTKRIQKYLQKYYSNGKTVKCKKTAEFDRMNIYKFSF